MKVDCQECHGSGEIPCPECDGSGGVHGDIETVRLERNLKNYSELLECQKDAKRVRSQAERLKIIKPQRSRSYDAQLEATLRIINAEADRLASQSM